MGGFLYEGRERVSYHAGDTAFSESVFRAIAEPSEILGTRSWRCTGGRSC